MSTRPGRISAGSKRSIRHSIQGVEKTGKGDICAAVSICISLPAVDKGSVGIFQKQQAPLGQFCQEVCQLIIRHTHFAKIDHGHTKVKLSRQGLDERTLAASRGPKQQIASPVRDTSINIPLLSGQEVLDIPNNALLDPLVQYDRTERSLLSRISKWSPLQPARGVYHRLPFVGFCGELVRLPEEVFKHMAMRPEGSQLHNLMRLPGVHVRGVVLLSIDCNEGPAEFDNVPPISGLKEEVGIDGPACAWTLRTCRRGHG
ncbi:hypothetical protein Trco_003227 [Trichoderma cornu-damae]|uniref:Uncharacterized protein n=1 Tax=Trichoderma cornu-damae TaxID=654480 RepID=A0A9P8QP94_9HYPO|nr:hypothetical protein Trco_003227 [Trichoderma cornu-damae]